MVEKLKNRLSLKNVSHKRAMRLACELLKKLNTSDEWDDQDQKKMERLKVMTGILDKMEPEIKKKPLKKFDLKKDEEIIKRFIERYKNEN